MALSATIRDNGHKLAYRRFLLNTRKQFCAVWVLELWHRLPRSCGMPSCKMFKSNLDVGLDNLLWVILLEQKWDKMRYPEVSLCLVF